MSDSDSPSSSFSTRVRPKLSAKQKQKSRHLPAYHVVLLDDNDHSVEYVMEMLKALFGYDAPRGYTIADEVNKDGRAVVFTTHKELAELKRDQIHAYGTDQTVATCKGSMSATIEPAE